MTDSSLSKAGKKFEQETGFSWPVAFWGLINCFTPQYDPNDFAYRTNWTIRDNVNNSHYENIKYMHSSLPLTVVENCIVFREAFSARWVRELFEKKATIDILSYGCGTGGDLLGLIYALHFSNLTGKHLRIYALDGNEDALRKCQIMMGYTNHFRGLGNSIEFHPIQFRTIVGQTEADTRFGTPRLGNMKFDIILTSKCLNELVKQNIDIYNYFLNRIVNPFLRNKGLALILDIAELRSMTYMEDKSLDLWTTQVLSQSVSRFRACHPDFHILLPFPCDHCPDCSCGYSATYYQLPLKEKNSQKPYSQALCYRLLIRSELPNKGREIDRLLNSHNFITVRRRTLPPTECCPKKRNKMGADLDGYKMIEAWKR